MALVLATVPKTGSHTMIALLGGQEAVGHAHELRQAVETGGHRVLFTHTFPEKMDELRAWKGRVPFIAPMRHPIRVLESWAKQLMAKSPGALPWGGLSGFVGAFDRLFSLDPVLFPLDRPEPLSERLGWLGRLVGSPLPRTIPHENRCDNPRRDLTEDEREAAAAIARHPRLAALGYGASP